MLKHYLARFPHPIRGIVYALRHDVSYRSQVYFVGFVIIALLLVLQPIESWELLFILLAYSLILITELQNSALEAALDRLHPELHDMIGKSKDMAAGAVLIAGSFLIVIIGTLVYTRFF